MSRKNLLLLTFIILTSCNSDDRLNLEDFNINYKIEDFYSKEIEKRELFESQRAKISEGKQEVTFGDELIKPWDFHDIEIEDIYINEFSYSKNKELLGTQYNMNSWSSGDSLAYYKNMYFERVDMMKSVEGDFMALIAINESNDEENFQKLLNYITQKKGEPETIEDDFFGKYTTFFWKTDDKIVGLNSKLDNKNNTLKIGVEINNSEIIVDSIKNPKIISKFFIVNNKYKDLLKDQLHSGDWLYIKYE